MLGVTALSGFGAGGGFVAEVALSGTVTDFDLGTHLQTYHAWDAVAPATAFVTIAADAILQSSHTGTPAFGVSLPTGSEVILTNHGSIIGRGGNGGAGGPGNGNPAGGVGGGGGDAISVNCPIIIDNHGLIAAGGGGGGGGQGDSESLYQGEDWYGASATGGGGGGGAGLSAGGSGGNPGGGGTHTVPGNGGESQTMTDGPASATSGAGGDGGAPGSSGGAGTQGDGGAGGAAGKYLVGAANVTWITVGDVRGPSA